jgi:hypothetical protein
MQNEADHQHRKPAERRDRDVKQARERIMNGTGSHTLVAFVAQYYLHSKTAFYQRFIWRTRNKKALEQNPESPQS